MSVVQYILLAGGATVIATVVPSLVIRSTVKPAFMRVILGLSAGLLFAIATMDLIPEALSMGYEVNEPERFAKCAMLGVGVGFFVLLFIEQMMGHEHTAHHDHITTNGNELSASFSYVAIVALSLHSFVDGLVIASAFTASLTVGARVAVAIILHKIPDGLVLSGITNAKRSWGPIVLVVSMTPLGAVIGLISFQSLPIPMIALAFILGFGAGTFVFISATGILPELMHNKGEKFSFLASSSAGYFGFIAMEVFLESTGLHAH